MTDKSKSPMKPEEKSARELRRERSAKALRENVKRRRQQGVDRQYSSDDPSDKQG